MRPTDSHAHHGGEAYLTGTALEDCPHPEGTPKALEWRIGWLEKALRDPLADDPDLEAMMDDHACRLEDARFARAALYRKIAAALPSAAAAAKAIKVPVKAWPGNCYAIAAAIFEAGLVDPLRSVHGHPRVTYGIYLGPIAPGTRFSGRPFANHGWLEFESGLVVDPTRWVFEGTKPALAAVPIDEYDLAGRRTRNFISSRPLPPFDPDGRIFTWDGNDADVREAVASLLGGGEDWDGRIGLSQMSWLGNLPLDTLGEHAKRIYEFFDRQGMIALVPIDNRNWLEDAPAGPGPR